MIYICPRGRHGRSSVGHREQCYEPPCLEAGVLKLAGDLRKKSDHSTWSNLVLTNLEQNTYWAFLIIRKMLEYNPECRLVVPVVSYIPYEQDGSLQPDRPRDQDWELMLLCNEMIHNSSAHGTFGMTTYRGGFICCSSRREHRRLLLLVDSFIELLEAIGTVALRPISPRQ